MLAASSDLTGLLEPLRDMQGVLGTALYGQAGELLAHDFPQGFGSARLRDMGARFHRLSQAFAGEAAQRTTTLVFGGHRVMFRDLGAASIVLLLSSIASTAALEVALRVAARDLAGYAQASQTGVAGAQVLRMPIGRSYRGRSI